MRDSGVGIKKIAKELSLGVGTVYSIMEKTNEPTFADMYKDRYNKA